jgi:hypothetical protein
LIAVITKHRRTTLAGLSVIGWNVSINADRRNAPRKGRMMPQTEPRQAIAACRLIERLMKTVLDLSPGAARLRLARIRNGTEWPSYDVTNSIAARGRWIGAMQQDQPLSDWRDFLPALLAGQCALHRIVEVRSAVPAFGFPSAAPSRVLVCPVAGTDGQLLGAIFIVWDGHGQPPERVALRGLMAAAKRLATQIAAVLDLCGELSCPVSAKAGDRMLQLVGPASRAQ